MKLKKRNKKMYLRKDYINQKSRKYATWGLLIN